MLRDSIKMLYVCFFWDVGEVFGNISANIYKILVILVDLHAIIQDLRALILIFDRSNSGGLLPTSYVMYSFPEFMSYWLRELFLPILCFCRS